MTQMTAANEWQGRAIVGSDDERIGRISDIYVDDQTDRPEWATVTSGLFSTSTHFVPLADASLDGEDVRVPVTKDEVRSAPRIDLDGHLSDQEEAQLSEHYGIAHSARRSDSAEGQPKRSSGNEAPASSTSHDVSGPTTDDAMTRSEEEPRIGTHRHVVTEQVTKTVPVQRDEARIGREIEDTKFGG